MIKLPDPNSTTMPEQQPYDFNLSPNSANTDSVNTDSINTVPAVTPPELLDPEALSSGQVQYNPENPVPLVPPTSEQEAVSGEQIPNFVMAPKQVESEQVESDQLTAQLSKEAAVTKQNADLKEEINNDTQRMLVEEKKRRDKMAAALESLKKEDKELESFKPSSFWQRTSTPMKILAAISVAAGAYASGLTGQPNMAYKIIQDSINNDLQTQQMDHNKRLARFNRAVGIVKLQIEESSNRTDNLLKKKNLEILGQKMQQLASANEQQRIMNKLAAEGKAPAARFLSKEQMRQSNQLRTEYNKLTTENNTRELISKYEMLEKAVHDPSAPRDIMLIFTFMKILDPRSVVRGNEVVMTAEAGPKYLALNRLGNKLAAGELFAQADRKLFLDAVKDIVKSKLASQQRINKQYTKLASEFGLPASIIVEDFDEKKLFPVDNEENKKRLMEKYKFSEEKANAILQYGASKQ